MKSPLDFEREEFSFRSGKINETKNNFSLVSIAERFKFEHRQNPTHFETVKYALF